MRLMDNKIYIVAAIAVAISIVATITIVSFDSSIEKVIVDSEEIITADHKNTQLVVKMLIEDYEKDIDFDALILGYNVNGKDPQYGFVINMETETIVAHPNKELIGQESFALRNSIEPYEQIISTLNNDGKIWVHYDFENPETEEVKPKTSLFQLHDGYIFGSGFYN